MARKDRDQRRAREAASRQRREAHAAAAAAAERLRMPVTQASTLLADALTGAGLDQLAARARVLEFDENYSLHDMPLIALVDALKAAGAVSLIDRVMAGDFDSTPEDNAAFYQTPRGRAERADVERMLADPGIRAQADKAIAAMAAADPRAQQRFLKEHVAAGTLAPPSAPATAADLADEQYAEARPLLTARLHGYRLGTQQIVAAAKLARRSGGRNWELGCDCDCDDATGHTGVPASWYCHATYNGITLGVAGQPNPETAARGFVARILDGGQCQHCKRVSTTNPYGAPGGNKILASTREKWTDAEQQAAGICLWTLQGTDWTRSCQQDGSA